MRRERKQFMITQPSLTLQEPARSCSIDAIVKQFNVTGLMPVSNTPARYGDSSQDDFQSHQFAIANAKSEFELLPLEERQKHGNPVAFLQNQIKQLHLDLEAAKQEKIDDELSPTPKEAENAPTAKPEASASRSNDEKQGSPEGEKTLTNEKA